MRTLMGPDAHQRRDRAHREPERREARRHAGKLPAVSGDLARSRRRRRHRRHPETRATRPRGARRPQDHRQVVGSSSRATSGQRESQVQPGQAGRLVTNVQEIREDSTPAGHHRAPGQRRTSSPRTWTRPPRSSPTSRTPDQLRIEVNWRSELMWAPGGGRIIPNIPTSSPRRANRLQPLPRTTSAPHHPSPGQCTGSRCVTIRAVHAGQVHARGTAASCRHRTCFPNFPHRREHHHNERVLKFSAYLAKTHGPISGRFGILREHRGWDEALSPPTMR